MIPFLDLKKMNAPYETTFQERFLAFLNSGHYILGKGVEKFEESFAAYCGAKFCIGTGNGLDALNLIFRGYIELGQLKEGDKIIVAANTYIATILAIKHAGLTPVLVEPDEGVAALLADHPPADPDELVAAQPDLGEICELMISQNLLRGQMAVVIVDGLVLGETMIQVAGCVCLQKEVVVNEGAHGKER